MDNIVISIIRELLVVAKTLKYLRPQKVYCKKGSNQLLLIPTY